MIVSDKIIQNKYEHSGIDAWKTKCCANNERKLHVM